MLVYIKIYCTKNLSTVQVQYVLYELYWYSTVQFPTLGTRKPLVLYKDERGDICIRKITQNARRPSRDIISSSQSLVAHIQRCSYNTSNETYIDSSSSVIDDFAVITLIPNSFVSIPLANIKLFPFRSSPRQHFTCLRSWVDWIRFVNAPSPFISAISQDIPSSIPPPPTIHLPGNTECIWIEKWIDSSRLKSDLYDVRHRIKNMPEVEFYTDGSLSTTHIRIPPQSSFDPSLAVDTQQGAAFIIPILTYMSLPIFHSGLHQRTLS